MAAPLALGGPRVVPPPMPREHGAWVMLYAPLAIGLLARPPAPVAALLLVIAATAAFLGQAAAAELATPRPRAGALGWALGWGLVLAAAGPALVWLTGRPLLLVLGLPAAALLGLHLRLKRGPARLRLDRHPAGQLLAAGTLVLTGPAAWLAGGGDPAGAGLLWGACLAAFASGILYVNLRLDAVKLGKGLDGPARWRLGRPLLAYHAALGAAAIAACVWLPLPQAALVVAATLPYLVRALLGVWRLAPGVPSFKRIGLAETAITLWFAACMIILL
jgi:hypothetical protein